MIFFFLLLLSIDLRKLDSEFCERNQKDFQCINGHQRSDEFEQRNPTTKLNALKKNQIDNFFFFLLLMDWQRKKKKKTKSPNLCCDRKKNVFYKNWYFVHFNIEIIQRKIASQFVCFFFNLCHFKQPVKRLRGKDR